MEGKINKSYSRQKYYVLPFEQAAGPAALPAA